MKSTIALTMLLIASPTIALADTLRVPAGQQAHSQQVERPSNGMNKDRVAERFGEPRAKNAAVGEPPISSWEYDDYVVYFEGDLVLHAVLKHRTASTR